MTFYPDKMTIKHYPKNYLLISNGFFFFSFNANRLIDKNNTLLLTNFNLNDNFLLFNPVALDNSSGVDVSLINSLRIR